MVLNQLRSGIETQEKTLSDTPNATARTYSLWKAMVYIYRELVMRADTDDVCSVLFQKHQRGEGG